VTRYSDERLLATLRTLAAELGRSPLVRDLRNRPNLPAPSTYRERFGSWSAVLRAAGLKHCQSRGDLVYSDEYLLDALRALAAELGRSPTSNEMLARPDLPASGTYAHRFGSWNAALEAAGLEPRRRPRFTDEELIAALRALAAELGRPPRSYEMQARRDLPSPGAYQRRFGSWNQALEAAGLGDQET
jgi:hypothetical protein